MRLFTPINVRYAGPIDTRFSVDTHSQLATLASLGVAYAYMKVVDKSDGKTYELQPDMRTWEVFSGPVVTAGNVQLLEGDPKLEITINSSTGKLDFKLTLPPYILGSESQELHTNDKTLIGAINEIYDMIISG